MSRYYSCLLSLLLVFAAENLVAQTTYRWINPKTGGIMVTDTAPPGNVKLLDRNPAAETDANANLPYGTRKAMQDFPVTLYTTPECAIECKDARDLLKQRGIPFTDKVIKSQQELEEMKTAIGSALVPTLKVGRQIFKGFLADDYNKLLDLAGYPTASYGKPPTGNTTK